MPTDHVKSILHEDGNSPGTVREGGGKRFWNDLGTVREGGGNATIDDLSVSSVECWSDDILIHTGISYRQYKELLM
jgi:hypothetical protein